MRFAVKRILTAATLAIVTFSSATAFAWGHLAHATAGYIADKYLSPKARAMVFSIVGPEPLFISSTYADHVRSSEYFKAFNPVHFIEIPTEFTASTLPDSQRAESDALTVLHQVPELLVGSRVSREQKMVLLRYLAHVLQDIHMPLHVGNGIDLSANLCEVRWPNPGMGGNLTNVHAALDDNLFTLIEYEFSKKYPPKQGQKKYFGPKELAEMIMAEFPPSSAAEQKMKLDFASANRSSFNDWLDESRELHAQVYPDREPVKHPSERKYCRQIDLKTRQTTNGKYDPNSIPTMTGAYIERTQQIIKKRVLQSGLRLAGLLNKIANGSSGSMTPQQEAGVIKNLVLRNKPSRAPQANEPPIVFRKPDEYPDCH